MKRRNISRAERAALLDDFNGCCGICKQPITGAWEADHIIPLEISRDDTFGNLQPAHGPCHREKTSKADQPTIAKVKRVFNKANNIVTRAKRKIRSRGFPTDKSRGFDGVVRAREART